jgi:hypothetical protein
LADNVGATGGFASSEKPIGRVVAAGRARRGLAPTAFVGRIAAFVTFYAAHAALHIGLPTTPLHTK